MDVILGMFGNLWGLLAGFGFVVAVGCGIWSGVQFMLAQGDPQKVAQARMGFVGVVVGLLMIGAAFVVPQVIQDEVIDDNIPVEIARGANSCDSTLQTQLRFQTQASNADRMNAVIRRIQLSGGDCANDVWAPEVVGKTGALLNDANAKKTRSTAQYTGGCTEATSLEGIAVPSTITGGTASSARDTSGRDSNGNIMVHFKAGAFPGNNAVCWLYNASVSAWLIGMENNADGK